MSKILSPGHGSKWAKATCIKCPATAFIRVPADEEKTVYMCPECTDKDKKDREMAN